jgi:sugar phosphate isomerase/epimerase
MVMVRGHRAGGTGDFMAHTRTGGFPIGFRRGWSDWQRDMATLIAFARAHDFACLDFGPIEAAELGPVYDAGLKVGSVDLRQWRDLTSADAGKRSAAIDANLAMVGPLIDLGVRNFFAVVMPEDKARDRRESFDLAVQGYAALGQKLAAAGGRIVLEGWPGDGENLACTPADLRAFFAATGCDAVGVNFDPSHLIRMGIDPVRFVDEFAPRVFHVHGKDTEILDDELYEHGSYQPATFARPHGFGRHHWRYTLPGHGCARWGRLFRTLHDAGYRGAVCIELEDEHCNGSQEGEQRGLIAARDFLAGV